VSNLRPESGESQRLFVALDLPEQVRDRIAAWQRRAAAEGLRAVRRQALHLTLAFLGEGSGA
jgi:2'-5' RNA ligase